MKRSSLMTEIIIDIYTLQTRNAIPVRYWWAFSALVRPLATICSWYIRRAAPQSIELPSMFRRVAALLRASDQSQIVARDLRVEGHGPGIIISCFRWLIDVTSWTESAGRGVGFKPRSPPHRSRPTCSPDRSIWKRRRRWRRTGSARQRNICCWADLCEWDWLWAAGTVVGSCRRNLWVGGHHCFSPWLLSAVHAACTEIITSSLSRRSR